MNLPVLSPRLQAVADFVPQNARLCDVGTDHAYLPIFLLLSGRISHAIASDIRPGPLSRAQEHGVFYGVSDYMVTRLSDGLSAIQPGEADCVTISGMGGDTMCGILQSAPWARKEHVFFILQPQHGADVLRRWLFENGYIIHSERVIREENRWYPVFTCSCGTANTTPTPAQLLAGNPDIWNPDDPYSDYIRYLLRQFQTICHGLSNSTKETDRARFEYLTSAIQDLQTILGAKGESES